MSAALSLGASSVPVPTGLVGKEPSNERLANTTACLPFIYGSVACFLGKKADEYHTHKWTLYLRGPNEEDLSPCIQKVVFHLHPSFSKPVREIVQPPYEVTERGWGEFEAQIRIIWKDSSEKATVVNHGIKLYPPGTTNMQPTKEPVVAESYDEAVFTDPKESFYQQLRSIADIPSVPASDPTVRECFGKFNDEDDFLKLLEAQTFLEKELALVKDRIRVASEEMEGIDDTLRELAEAKKMASHRAAASAKTKASVPAGGPSTKKQKGS